MDIEYEKYNYVSLSDYLTLYIGEKTFVEYVDEDGEEFEMEIDEKDYVNEDKIDLFGVYSLTKEEFNKYKEEG